ncbi:hypothetical protein [Phyllobacterium myrsinacearum]|uniref:Uncharacterized protein n=1 Tax=Phyllobacterium myrsinacearum TaxID=28101 RepID=A0A839EZ80_9HYPH|nr:hypothetical protein [Phyllobacterium myrsinacearum]MBA8881687.1 hypothetical protein [Phyllobacterium myrsinacearum]
MRDTMTIRDLERQFMIDTRSKTNQAQSSEDEAFTIDGKDLLAAFAIASFISAVAFISWMTIYAF